MVAFLLPGAIVGEAGGFSCGGCENFVAPKSEIGGRRKVQRARIPPNYRVYTLLRRMQTWFDGGFVVEEKRTIDHGRVAELGAARSRGGVAVAIRWRVDGFVQRAEPAVHFLIADGWNHQQIAGARGGNVSHADTFGTFAQSFLRFVVAEFPRCATQQASGAETGACIDETVRIAGRDVSSHVGQNHNRKLQAFGGMDGHQPDAFGAFFEYGSLMRFRFFRLRLQLFDEAAEGDSARELERAGEIADTIDVGEHLVSGGAQSESGVSTC